MRGGGISLKCSLSLECMNAYSSLIMEQWVVKEIISEYLLIYVLEENIKAEANLFQIAIIAVNVI